LISSLDFQIGCVFFYIVYAKKGIVCAGVVKGWFLAFLWIIDIFILTKPAKAYIITNHRKCAVQLARRKDAVRPMNV